MVASDSVATSDAYKTYMSELIAAAYERDELTTQKGRAAVPRLKPFRRGPDILAGRFMGNARLRHAGRRDPPVWLTLV